VIETISAFQSSLAEWDNSFPPLKKRMFLRHSSFVVVDSFGLVVLQYSHDLIAKKNAPTINWAQALEHGSSLL
jgi:hypothetical protein